MNILAIDPATRCGWAHSNGGRGLVTLKGEQGEKLDQLASWLDHWIGRVDKIAFEDASFGSRVRRVMAFHNAARGIIEAFASRHGMPIVKYVPATIKKYATGNGHATKVQMIRSLKLILGVEAADDNIADACWVLDMAMHDYQPPPSAKKRKRAAKAALKKQARLF